MSPHGAKDFAQSLLAECSKAPQVMMLTMSEHSCYIFSCNCVIKNRSCMFPVSPGGFSLEQTLIQELKTGCTQVDTLTGISLTVPTFIDTGGAQREDHLPDRIHFISQHLRFVSLRRLDAHWYCVFVWIIDKLISKWYQAVYQIMTVNIGHRRNATIRRILEFTHCKCRRQTSSSLYALNMILK